MIKNPVILITGASRGLGREMAKVFAAHHYAVAINFNSSEKEAVALSEEIKTPTLLLKADVSSSAQVDAMTKKIIDKWGRIDVLINNAGISADRTLSKMSDEEWKKVLAVNLDGPFFCSRAVLPSMKDRKEGLIINIISYLVKSPAVGAANYAASKAGLLALTKSLALEEGRHNIRVNAVMPGFHVTDMNKKVWTRYEKLIRDQHLLKDLPEKRELAEFVYSLSLSKKITGQEFAFESRLF